MAAHFYCWESTLQLRPLAPDFNQQIESLHKSDHLATPSKIVLNFVEKLLSRFPNSDKTREENIWAVSGPLLDQIIGGFVHLAVLWYYYEEAAPFIITTATACRLHCFDAQRGEVYPAMWH